MIGNELKWFVVFSMLTYYKGIVQLATVPVTENVEDTDLGHAYVCDNCKNLTCVGEGQGKKCNCDNGYAFYIGGLCKACDCGEESIGCAFMKPLDADEYKLCACNKGYKDVSGTCKNDENSNLLIETTSLLMETTLYDPCKEYPAYCGALSGAKCVFNQRTKTVTCECSGGGLKYDEQRKKCRLACYNHIECLNGGTCEGTWDKRFCYCNDGVSGDTCANISECDTGRFRNCTGDRGTCKYDGDKLKPFCECSLIQKYNTSTYRCDDICTPETCSDGICDVVEDDFQCRCLEGFTGRRCDQKRIQATSDEFPWQISVAVLSTICVSCMIGYFCLILKKLQWKT